MTVELRIPELRPVDRHDRSAAHDWGRGSCAFCGSATSRYSEPVDVGRDELRVRVCNGCQGPYPLVPRGWMPEPDSQGWVPEAGDEAEAERVAWLTSLADAALWRAPLRVCGWCGEPKLEADYPLRREEDYEALRSRCRDCLNLCERVGRQARVGGVVSLNHEEAEVWRRMEVRRLERERDVRERAERKERERLEAAERKRAAVEARRAASEQRKRERQERDAAERERRRVVRFDIQEARCSLCETWKPFSAFSMRHGKNQGRPHSWCKACASQKRAERMRRARERAMQEAA